MASPKSQRDYIHCLTCNTPLENEAMRRVETPTIYFDFAVCNDCRRTMLKQETPCVQFWIAGDELKGLLKGKSGKRAIYGMMPDAKIP